MKIVEPGKLLKGTMVLTLGQVCSYGLSFTRNLILARVLAKADFGLAALFGMTVSLLEIAGRMSFGQQIIQSKAGDSSLFEGTSHAFQAALAFTGSLLILAISRPMSEILKVPGLTWAFAMMAVVPFSRAFEHLDYYRQQRELNYLPTMLCDLVPQIVITVLAWPLSVWIGDFRVIVYLMVGKSLLGTTITHVLAKRPYRWAWHPEYVSGMWRFGWPLLINGLLIFASQQADQLLVGAVLSLENLASYALAFSLVSIPWSIFAQVGFPLILPVLSRAQDDLGQFRNHYKIAVQYAAVASVCLTVPLIVAGERIVVLFYGSKYAGAGVLIALLGAASTLRFLRLVPSVASMARADTMNQLYSNLWRGLSLPLAGFVALAGGGVALIATSTIVAEVAASVVSLVRLRKRQGVPLRDTAGAALYVTSFLFASLILVYVDAVSTSRLLSFLGAFGCILLAVIVACASFPDAIATLRRSLKKASSARVANSNSTAP